MSLYLPDQKLGSHSQPGGSSHKFVLKGRQTGSMHRGHSWVFRAESYDTMMAWYEDIKTLTEKTGEERNAFVRRHARSVSQGSHRSVSSDGGMDEDEADAVPYSANQSILSEAVREAPPQRPSPGGRFPSDLQVDRHLQAPLSPSSGSSDVDHDLTTAAGGLQSGYMGNTENSELAHPQPLHQQQALSAAQYDGRNETSATGGVVNPYELSPQTPTQTPYSTSSNAPPAAHQPVQPQSYSQPQYSAPPSQPAVQRHESNYGDWMGPAGGGVAAGALGATAYRNYQDRSQEQDEPHEQTPLAEAPAAPVIPPKVPVTEEAPASSSLPFEPTPAPVWAPSANPSAGTETTISTIATAVPSEPATSKSFLEPAEAAAPAAASASNMNGPQAPGILRNNTDISVSDLHVPGEYPKASKVTRGAAI